jgi:hypothetical protein
MERFSVIWRCRDDLDGGLLEVVVGAAPIMRGRMEQSRQFRYLQMSGIEGSDERTEEQAVSKGCTQQGVPESALIVI